MRKYFLRYTYRRVQYNFSTNQKKKIFIFFYMHTLQPCRLLHLRNTHSICLCPINSPLCICICVLECKQIDGKKKKSNTHTIYTVSLTTAFNGARTPVFRECCCIYMCVGQITALWRQIRN